jgi:hypothetical protein
MRQQLSYLHISSFQICEPEEHKNAAHDQNSERSETSPTQDLRTATP